MVHCRALFSHNAHGHCETWIIKDSVPQHACNVAEFVCLFVFCFKEKIESNELLVRESGEASFEKEEMIKGD